MIITFQRTRNGVKQETAIVFPIAKISTDHLRALSDFVFSGPHTEQKFHTFMDTWSKEI
jgi:hypothetical protein